MFQLIDPAARSVATATLLGALLLASPLARAATDDGVRVPVQVAQAQSAPNATDQAQKGDPVERHIKRLHDRLKITAQQEPQWSALAQVMRDNAHTMQAVVQKRHSGATMTAVDDLRSYQEAAETHVQNLQKMIPAFQALYDSMSDDQKKNADAVFSQERRHGRSKKQ